MRLRLAALVAALLWVGHVGCGARSGLRSSARDDAGPDAAAADASLACATPADCDSGDRCQPMSCVEGVCVASAPVVCDDGDPCTDDRCVPETGACEFAAATFDRDGDGHFGPRPGFAPGEPLACGDDCDDTSPLAFPGGSEVCDGVDNDCNGVIDDRAEHVVEGAPVRLTSEGLVQGRRGSIAYEGNHYAVAYRGQRDNQWTNYFKALQSDGSEVVPETRITNVNSDTFTGPLVWTGAVFGAAWEDRRDNDFEIYFNRLDRSGQKLGPDVRVTRARDFSTEARMVFNGREFLLAWTDRRTTVQIFGQRIAVDGALVGPNLALTEPAWQAESAALALGRRRIAIAFALLEGGIGFRTFDMELGAPGDLVRFPGPLARDLAITFAQDRFIIAWERQEDGVPGEAIHAMAVLEDGTVVVAERPVTEAAGFAKTPSLLSLGDRALMAWSDQRDENFEIYAKHLSLELEELTPRQRLSNDPAQSLYPLMSFGPEGEIGVVFDDRRTGTWQPYFVRLSCFSVR